MAGNPLVQCRYCPEKILLTAYSTHRRERHPTEWAAERKKANRTNKERNAQKRAEKAAQESMAATKSPTASTEPLPQEQSKAQAQKTQETPPAHTQEPPPASVLKNEPLEEVPEAKPSKNGKTKEPAGSTVKLQFVARTVQLDARVLLFYNLSRQRFPEYVATEGEWLLDVVTRYYAEHAEDFGLDMSTMLQEVQTALLLEEEG